MRLLNFCSYLDALDPGAGRSSSLGMAGMCRPSFSGADQCLKILCRFSYPFKRILGGRPVEHPGIKCHFTLNGKIRDKFTADLVS